MATGFLPDSNEWKVVSCGVSLLTTVSLLPSLDDAALSTTLRFGIDDQTVPLPTTLVTRYWFAMTIRESSRNRAVRWDVSSSNESRDIEVSPMSECR